MDKANNTSFSIVIVNFNMEEFLEDALQSVVRQDYPKELVQLIVIDGGSTDTRSISSRNMTNILTIGSQSQIKGKAMLLIKGLVMPSMNGSSG